MFLRRKQGRRQFHLRTWSIFAECVQVRDDCQVEMINKLTSYNQHYLRSVRTQKRGIRCSFPITLKKASRLSLRAYSITLTAVASYYSRWRTPGPLKSRLHELLSARKSPDHVYPTIHPTKNIPPALILVSLTGEFSITNCFCL